MDQFHNPALDPEPYWLEALRRDPGESRVNTALGVLGLRRGDWQGAEQRLRKALERLTAGYTTPAEGDAHFYLGVALRAQGSDFEAERAFRKAAWNAAWNGPACYEAAELASRRGEWSEALQLLDRSLDSNRRNQRAWTLRAALLRVNGRIQEAIEASKMALSIDPLDLRAQAELRMAGQEAPVVQGILERFPAEGLEVAAEYVAAGLSSDAETVLSWMESTPSAAFSPLVLYLKGYVLDQTGRSAEAEGLWQRASSAPAGGVFPFQSEFIQVLRRVMASRPGDARPPYYLGTLLFDWQPDEAVRLWETAAALDPEFPIVHRNLGLAYARQEGGLERAIRFLERAVELGDHPIHLFELDQLYEAAAVSPERRLEMLERYHSRVVQRDDALARSVELKVVAGKYDEALELMRGRRFNVWEGGARFSVHDTWTDAHLLRGRKSLAASRPEAALADFEAAIEFPENLQVARFRRGGRHAEVAYWIGVAKSAAGDDAGAREAWEDAAEGIPVVGGDDILPTTDRTVQFYYQALALERLGKGAEAEPIYRGIVRSAQQALDRGHRDDFFAKFGEQQTWRAATAQAHFLKGLGLSGLGERSAAAASFAKALELRPEHLGARTEVP
jgi:tetratricopeptide (TPR) repeat protein